MLNYIIHSILQSGRFGTPTTNLKSDWETKIKQIKEHGFPGSVESARRARGNSLLALYGDWEV